MKKLFGIPILRPRMTDEEYVEHLRKLLRADRKIKFLQLVFGLLMMGGTAWMVWKFQQFSENMIREMDNYKAVNAERYGLAVGILMGAIAGWMLSFGMLAIAMSFVGPKRLITLVIKYYDEVKGKNSPGL